MLGREQGEAWGTIELLWKFNYVLSFVSECSIIYQSQ